MQEMGNLKITKIWTFFEVSDLQLHSTYLPQKKNFSLPEALFSSPSQLGCLLY